MDLPDHACPRAVEHMTSARSHVTLRTIAGLILGALFLVGPWLGAGLLVIAVPSLRELIADQPFAAILYAFGLSILFASAGLVSTTALAVVLGMVLPFPWALAIGVFACVAATIIQLAAARSTLAPALSAFGDRSGRARHLAVTFSDMTKPKTALVFAVARLAPQVPFAATNLALGALKPHLLAAVVGSGVGAVVRMGVFAWAGRGVSDLDAVLSGEGLSPIWSIVTIGSGVVLLVFVAQWLVKWIGLGGRPSTSAPAQNFDRNSVP